MPRIVFIEADGARRIIEAPVGISLMEAAKQNAVVGVIALCGGACACATCHVYVDERWIARLRAPEEMEQGMLETAWEPRANSRLSCQVPITADMDGIELKVPEQQN
jgi:2Fe-2S ferredoxin